MVKQTKELIQDFECLYQHNWKHTWKTGVVWAIFVIQQNDWINPQIYWQGKLEAGLLLGGVDVDFLHDKVQVSISEISFLHFYILKLVLPTQTCNSPIQVMKNWPYYPSLIVFQSHLDMSRSSYWI